MEYLKEFYFSNITCYNDVLNEILNENYKTYTKQIANIFINDNNDYNKFIRNEFLKPTFLSLNDKNQSYVLNVFFTKTLSINSNSEMNINNRGYDIINLFGNNTKIYAESGKRDENKWVSLDNENLVFTVSNMKIEGFNTAIENKCSSIILVNVTLNNNIMDYIIDADWGAAILNAGLCQCYDCTFTNNYCCNGGAIFNQGVLELENCTFKGNTAYGKGNDVLNVDKGTVILNTEKIVGSKGPISYEESISTGMAKFYTYLAAIGTISVAVLTTVLVSIACGGNVIAGAAAGGIVGSAISGSIGTGVAVGLTVGAGAALLFGSWTAYEINSQTYNIYHDRVQTAKQCIGGALMCAVTGAAIGGVFSYGILASYAANANSIIATQTGNVEMINEPKGGEYTYESNGVTLKSPDALDKKIVDNIVNHVLSGEEEGNGNLIKEIVIDGKEVRATDNYRTINNIKITQEVTYEYKVYFKDGIIGYGDGTYPYINGVADLNIVKSLDKPLNFIDGVADLTTAKSWEP